jgi:hypothetical protein
VVRQPFTFLRANIAAERLFPGLTQLSPEQLIDVWFGLGPFRDRVLNWPEVIQAGLTALRYAAADTGDAEVIRLLQRAQAHTQDRLVMSGADVEASPVTCPVFELGEQSPSSTAYWYRQRSAATRCSWALRPPRAFRRPTT